VVRLVAFDEPTRDLLAAVLADQPGDPAEAEHRP
jgi:hypothetical protein